MAPAAAPPTRAATAEGHATLTSLRRRRRPGRRPRRSRARPAATALPRSDKPIPYVARGEGALAPALGAGQVTRSHGGRGRGLLATACAAPSGEAWFVGGGGSVGRRTTVLLPTPTRPRPWSTSRSSGPDGPVAARGGEGVLVPAASQQTLRLDVLVPGTTRTALHVVARAGRVSAAVEDVDTKGLIPRGADYVPQSRPPATRVVVPGVLGGTAGARLPAGAAPGDADAIVNVHLVADGRHVRARVSAALLEIAAGSVAQVDLAPFLDGDMAATACSWRATSRSSPAYVRSCPRATARAEAGLHRRRAGAHRPSGLRTRARRRRPTGQPAASDRGRCRRHVTRHRPRSAVPRPTIARSWCPAAPRPGRSSTGPAQGAGWW